MIYIGNVNDIDLSYYDSVWYITNNTPNMHLGCEHHPELAPNKKLYSEFRKGNCTLDYLLVNYAQELLTTKSPAVENLIKESRYKEVLCVCYCKSFDKCHRSILYKELINRGIRAMVL